MSPVSMPSSRTSCALPTSSSSTTQTFVRKSGAVLRSSSSVTWMEFGVRQTAPV